MNRTGGSSVRDIINNSFFIRLFVKFNEHNISISDLRLRRKDIVIIFLRDPKSWYESMYRNKMQTKKNLWGIKDFPLMNNNSYKNFIEDCYFREDKLAVKKWFKPWSDYHERAFISNSEPIYKAFYKFYLFGENKYSFDETLSFIHFINTKDINYYLPKYINKKINLPLIKKIPNINITSKKKNYKFFDFKFEEDLKYYEFIKDTFEFIKV